jgi:NADH dehydrogenase
MAAEGRPRVLILGAGFAGVGVFQALRKEMSKKEVDITLVDRNNFSLYTPMLAEVCGGAVEPEDVVAPIRTLIRRKCTFDQAEVEEIDITNRKVRISVGGRYGVPKTERDLEYDQLVIAMGSTDNYHHIPGVEENSIGAKEIEDAIEIRNRGLALLERADEEEDTRARRHLLTFVVAGGGFTGVEVMAALNAMLRELAGRHYPNVTEEDIRTIIILPGGRLLPETGEKLAAYTAEALQRRGVEIIFNAHVTGAGPDWVDVKPKAGGETQRIEAHTFIWAGGVQPVPAVHASGLPIGKHGGIQTDSTCRVFANDNVWALGDCAEVPVPHAEGTYAPTAQNAIREGKRVGKNIAAVLRGREPEPFVFTPIGELAVVGTHSGVAILKGMRVKGRKAWWMWRWIYLAKLPRMNQRVRVAIDWFTESAFGVDCAQLPAGRGPKSVDVAKETVGSGT